MIQKTASVQYDTMTGTAAIDNADFETYEEVLALPEGWLVVGLSLYTAHGSLGIEGKDHASSAIMSLRAWAIWGDNFSTSDGGLQRHLERTRTLSVGQFDLQMSDAPLADPLDPVGVLVRGAKRFNLVVWHETLQSAGIDSIDLIVRERWYSDDNANTWVSEQG